jgi:molybdopterin-dependent oxidoreductase alpha subunit
MKSQKPEIPPTEDARPQISTPPVTAGGIPAILSSMKHIMKEVGPVRGPFELLKVNQKKGFDCPGCAWPDPDGHRAVTEFCENGAKAVAEEATSKVVDAAFFAKHSVKELSYLSDYEIGKSGRLCEPMWLKPGGTHYEPIGWNQAFELIAEKLESLNSPDEAIFYTSGRTSNEAAFVYQLFVRMFGTNNLPDCSNMCHESSGIALRDTIGVGKGTVTLEDFDKADCIMVIGQNPGTNHPRMLTSLQSAAQKGAKIISMNPLLETGVQHFKHPQQFWTWIGKGTPIASLHLPVKINSDMAALKGIMKELFLMEEKHPGKVINWDFIKQNTSGFDKFLAELHATSWESILQQTGLTRENIHAAAQVIAESKSMICCWAMGLTQQTEAVPTIQEVVNLLLLGGHFGRPGAGACPVRGHSNVQGDRTMGIYEKPPQAFLNSLESVFKFKPPQEHGWDVVDCIHAMHEKKAKVFFAMGGNFLSATPDTEYTARALRNMEMTIQVSTKLNRSHLICGQSAFILPCLARTDVDHQASGPQFVTVENSMSVVSSSRGNLEQKSKKLLSEISIVCGLARAMFKDNTQRRDLVNWTALESNYDNIRDLIEKTIPGFNSFNKRVREPSGFYLPNAVRDALKFDTPIGKAIFTTTVLPHLKIPDHCMLLMTMRSHDQFNTTIYGLNDRYRGIHNGRRVIFMNASDIQKLKLSESQWVDITSHFADKTRKADRFMVVKYDIPEGSAATYFPETNVLVPIESVAGQSNTPTYKSIVVSLSPSAQTEFDIKGAG